MSFFGETKNFGWVFTISELIAIISAVIGLVMGLTNSDEKLGVGGIVIAAGTIVGALLTLIFAIGVVKGNYIMKFGRFVDDASTPFGVLCGYLAIGGIAGVIIGVTGIVGGIIEGSAISADGILVVVIALIELIIVAIMTDGKKTFADKVIFIILAILFILTIIAAVLAVIASVAVVADGWVGIVALVASIFALLEALFITAFLFSGSTKKELGM